MLTLRTVLLCSLLVAGLLASTLALLNHEDLRLQQEFHGWDRAVEIATISGKTMVKLPKPAAEEVLAWIQSPLSWSGIISAQALSDLRNLASVESVNRVMTYGTLRDQFDGPVAISVVDPGFVDAFRLGNGSQLGPELAVGASSVAHAQSVVRRYPAGEVFLRMPPMSHLPPAQRAEFDKLSPARQTLSTAVFASRPLWLEGRTQFYVSPDWISSPGRNFGPSFPLVSAIVKLKPGISMDAALPAIQAILDAAPSPLIFNGQVAHARPLLDAPGTDKARRALLLAGHWIPVALAAALALCALAIIWLRFRALGLELALRRGFGQSRWASALHTLLPEFIRLGAATVGAGLIAWIWFAAQGHAWAAPKLWPATVAGVAVGAGFALLLAFAIVRRPTALLLKNQTD